MYTFFFFQFFLFYTLFHSKKISLIYMAVKKNIAENYKENQGLNLKN